MMSLAPRHPMRTPGFQMHVPAPATTSTETLFRLGPLTIDPRTGEAAGPGGVVKLDPKVMGVLVMLAQNAGHVVLRSDLLERLWPGVVVTDESLSRCIYELRRQLSQAAGDEQLKDAIETLPKRGYRLMGEVTPIPPEVVARPFWKRPVPISAAALTLVAAVVGGMWVLAPASKPTPTTALASSIVVLPFEDLSETHNQAYLADGFAEEILDRLHHSTDLRVIARTSAFALRGKNLDVEEIARKLQVTHVLEGSVRKSGDSIRVTAQLIATADSSHLWSSTFERRLGDLFAIQDEIATAVASALRATLNLAERHSSPMPNIEAYDLVKRGEHFYYRRAPGDIERSVELFEQAVVIDPAYARAWAVLAGAYSFQAWAVDPPSEVLRARQGDAALRAVALDPSLAVAQARLAQYYEEAGDDANRRKHIQLAVQADPDDPLVLGYQASDALDADDFDTAIELHKRALLRDPLNSVIRQNLGVVLIADGRLEEALATYQALMAINPDASPDIEIEISRILALLGRLDEAASAALELPAGKYRDQAMALLGALPGHRDEADAALHRLEAYVPASPQDTLEYTIMDSVRLAEIYAYRGRPDRAFATLTAKFDSLRAHPQATIATWYLRRESRLAPFLMPLHADPRWAAFIGKQA